MQQVGSCGFQHFNFDECNDSCGSSLLFWMHIERTTYGLSFDCSSFPTQISLENLGCDKMPGSPASFVSCHRYIQCECCDPDFIDFHFISWYNYHIISLFHLIHIINSFNFSIFNLVLWSPWLTVESRVPPPLRCDLGIARSPRWREECVDGGAQTVVISNGQTCQTSCVWIHVKQCRETKAQLPRGYSIGRASLPSWQLQ